VTGRLSVDFGAVTDKCDVNILRSVIAETDAPVSDTEAKFGRFALEAADVTGAGSHEALQGLDDAFLNLAVEAANVGLGWRREEDGLYRPSSRLRSSSVVPSPRWMAA
jgi:hypothetical protein